MIKKNLPDLTKLSISDLFATYNAVLNELRCRNIIRSSNNPTGDYVEWLVSNKLGLELNTKSAKGFDAIDSQGRRYQIKGRRVTPENKSTQLGVLRNLDSNHFDFLVGVILDANWKVLYAAKIPYQIVSLLATFRQHQNGHIMHLRQTVFNIEGIENISNELLS